jgi:hypothetical protein
LTRYRSRLNVTAFVASNRAFEAVVRASFARQTFMGTLGAALGPGTA